MKVGFTGTQHGMTGEQALLLNQLLHQLKPTEFHHGCCVGADEVANRMANAFDIPTVAHPPLNEIKMALNLINVTTLPPKEYLERNMDIVDATDCLIATPWTTQEVLRSGTWATVRYARRKGRTIYLLFPHGEVRKE
jgi:hypothetical protein